METVHRKLNRWVVAESRNVFLFLDNVPCHPPVLQHSFSNLNTVFFPKAHLHQCNLLMQGLFKILKYSTEGIFYSTYSNLTSVTSVLIIDLLLVIQACKEVKSETIQNCCSLCSFSKEIIDDNDDDEDPFDDLQTMIGNISPGVSVDVKQDDGAQSSILCLDQRMRISNRAKDKSNMCT